MADAAVRAVLERRWNSLSKDCGISNELASKWWSIINQRHSESQRAYHTLSHLAEMFQYFEEHKGAIVDKTAVSFAIFFHDIIYNPRSGSPRNEADSADVFDTFGQEALPAGDPPGLLKGELIAKVKGWIHQTAHHKCSEEDSLDCKLFMDFDMAVLGRPWPDYDLYSKQIRQEYSHVPDSLYCSARGAFLESTAAGSGRPIYATDVFRSQREARARENAGKEAALLKTRWEQCPPLARWKASLLLKLKAFSSRRQGQLALLGTASGILAVAVAAAPSAAAAVAMGGAAAAGLASAAVAGVLVSSKHLRLPLPAYPPETGRGVAVFAGSFNPPHSGHLEIAKFLHSAHESVHLVIGVNPNKKYAVSPYVRQELLRKMLKEVGLDSVQVAVVSTYVWRYAQQVGATALYRGIRTWLQDGPMEKFLELQNLLGQVTYGFWPIPTVYLPAARDHPGLSSSLLRQRLKDGLDISDVVPPGCASAVAQVYSGSGVQGTQACRL